MAGGAGAHVQPDSVLALILIDSPPVQQAGVLHMVVDACAQSHLGCALQYLHLRPNHGRIRVGQAGAALEM